MPNDKPVKPEQSDRSAGNDTLRIEVPATAENVGHARHAVADFLERVRHFASAIV